MFPKPKSPKDVAWDKLVKKIEDHCMDKLDVIQVGINGAFYDIERKDLP